MKTKPKTPPQTRQPEYTFDAHEQIAVVYGPRGGIDRVFAGPGFERKAIERCGLLIARFAEAQAAGKDLGQVPIWMTYTRQLTSPRSRKR